MVKFGSAPGSGQLKMKPGKALSGGFLGSALVALGK
jgi:hypothetical protein